MLYVDLSTWAPSLAPELPAAPKMLQGLKRGSVVIHRDPGMQLAQQQSKGVPHFQKHHKYPV